MKKLVLCGCSLGESWMPYFESSVTGDYYTWYNNYRYDDVTRSKEKWDTTWIQLGGGGHGYMVNGLHDYFLTNDILSSTIVAQFTGFSRKTLVTKKPMQNRPESKKFQHQYSRLIVNKLTDNEEYHLCDNQWKELNDDYPFNRLSGDYDYVNLISSLCMLSKLGADVYVFRGWQNNADKIWDNTKNYLKKSNITYTELDYLSECIKLSTKEEDWEDDTHPQASLGTKAFHNIWKDLNANK